MESQLAILIQRKRKMWPSRTYWKKPVFTMKSMIIWMHFVLLKLVTGSLASRKSVFVFRWEDSSSHLNT